MHNGNVVAGPAEHPPAGCRGNGHLPAHHAGHPCRDRGQGGAQDTEGKDTASVYPVVAKLPTLMYMYLRRKV